MPLFLADSEFREIMLRWVGPIAYSGWSKMIRMLNPRREEVGNLAPLPSTSVRRYHDMTQGQASPASSCGCRVVAYEPVSNAKWRNSTILESRRWLSLLQYWKKNALPWAKTIGLVKKVSLAQSLCWWKFLWLFCGYFTYVLSLRLCGQGVACELIDSDPDTLHATARRVLKLGKAWKKLLFISNVSR